MDLKEKIPFNTKLGLLIAIVVVIIACLFIPYTEPQPYKKVAQAFTKIIEFPQQTQQLKEPPPPPKPQMPIPAATDEEAERSTIDKIGTDFAKGPIIPLDEEIIPFYKVQEPPKIIYQPDCEFPEFAQKAEIEGKVYVSIIVDTSGNVIDAKVIKSLHPVLDEAAIKCVRQWKYTPAKQRDKTVKVRMEFPINFQFNR